MSQNGQTHFKNIQVDLQNLVFFMAPCLMFDWILNAHLGDPVQYQPSRYLPAES